ncbi:MAG TPA: NADH-ubiquinone oxidoreductase-F iron-sulfur binding region domain-containing protein [Planctomycetota bacterium]|nr:NADH-ubiquinone oxidoreductase-F iron-sulfur binding region domain-containing protein [Planctomycetota bacterium]
MASASFYHLEKATAGLCRGTACFVGRHRHPDRWRQACAQEVPVYCLGKCHQAPASASEDGRPRVEVHSRKAVVLERVARPAPYGAYDALTQARDFSREALVRAVEASGLRGRGGAGYPAGKKWAAVLHQPGPVKFVVANADEGDPGAYIDRMILEEDPHALIEGLAIAAHAVGAGKGYLYLRKEYPQAERAVRAALSEDRSGFPIELVIGQGSYVCGEETALLNSIEGKRPEVRVRPPYPTERGLFGKPTLVQNVETLVNIPWIVRNGAEAYRSLGFSKSRGTKAVSLNSLFKRPGLYEVEFGIPVRRIVEEIGGGLADGRLKGVIIGGPLAGILPPSLLDTPFGFEELRAVGASVGHGGIVAFDDRTSIADLVHHVFEFGAFESCGKCTPCRLGSRRVEEIFRAVKGARREVEEIVSALRTTSLCGLGTGLAEFAESALRHYPEELSRWLA